MASTPDFLDYVCEQAGLPGRLSSRRMFGEYALYVDGVVVGFICDNQVFVKPTDAARLRLGGADEGHPYPGARPHLMLNGLLDEPGRLREWLLVTAAALPPPKPRPSAPSSGGPAPTPSGSRRARPLRRQRTGTPR